MRILIASLIFMIADCDSKVKMVTFVDCENLQKFALPLRNKACYARHHRYVYELKLLQNRRIIMSSGIRYQKPFVLAEAMARSAEDEIVIWSDADLVVMNSSRRFHTELINTTAADLWVTDHNCNPNSGALVLRNNNFVRTFIRDWISTCSTDRFPFHENGCFYQQILLSATGNNVSLIKQCDFLLKNKRGRGPQLMKCVIRIWNQIFGAFTGNADRISRRVGLRRADDGFNNQYCHPDRNVDTYCRWHDPPGWSPSTCFQSGMFALHGNGWRGATTPVFPSKQLHSQRPRTDIDKASTFDAAIRACIQSNKSGLIEKATRACQSGSDIWIRLIPPAEEASISARSAAASTVDT